MRIYQEEKKVWEFIRKTKKLHKSENFPRKEKIHKSNNFWTNKKTKVHFICSYLERIYIRCYEEKKIHKSKFTKNQKMKKKKYRVWKQVRRESLWARSREEDEVEDVKVWLLPMWREIKWHLEYLVIVSHQELIFVVLYWKSVAPYNKRLSINSDSLILGSQFKLIYMASSDC